METEKYVFFYGHAPNNLGLQVFSQWFPITFTEYIEKDTPIIYSNMEQYMMVHKALLFGDHYYLEKIMGTTQPALIKQYGRKIRGFDPDIWDGHKFDIVVEGNRLKFSQNPALMKRLLETNDKIIVEASPYDKIWGIGLKKEVAVNIPESKWPGQNLLGKALMIVREENQ